MFVIAGLGNPGKKYENTRHNMGFLTIDKLAEKNNIKVNKIKHKALVGDGIISGQRVLLVKPQTYMNLSGESLREIVSYYNINLKNMLVIYDDFDLEAGTLRIRKKRQCWKSQRNEVDYSSAEISGVSEDKGRNWKKRGT